MSFGFGISFSRSESFEYGLMDTRWSGLNWFFYRRTVSIFATVGLKSYGDFIFRVSMVRLFPVSVGSSFVKGNRNRWFEVRFCAQRSS